MGFTEHTHGYEQIAKGSHIDLDVIKALGYPLRRASETGFRSQAVELTYDDLDGKAMDLWRRRFAKPPIIDGKPRRYLGRKGDPVQLFLPRWARKNSKKVWERT